jgi:hypothetical protein
MVKGKIYLAQAEDNLSQSKPMFAFVPTYLFKNQEFQAKEYSLRGWDSINCGANKHAIGSHLFPDLSKPIAKSFSHKTPEVQEFVSNLQKLMHKHISKLKEFKKPGKQLETHIN